MAFKMVVTNAFVQQLIKLIQAMETSEGQFTLAMLVPSESTDKWNFVVSAKWIDEKKLLPAIPTITTALLEHLSKTNAGKIERVSPLSTKNSFVRDVVAEVEVTHGTAYRVQSFSLNARNIKHAIILVAQNPRAARNGRPRTVRARG